ncbi:hypothetical protein B0H14DRAFT_3483424 [Mycena olivaceomarginata]|nr:hypothetical protein B0H14DRAFT_3483424 [Mycena olivaceomarginata]
MSRPCMYCGKLQKMRGAANHEKHCRRLQAQKLQSQACSEEFQRREMKELLADFIRNQKNNAAEDRQPIINDNIGLGYAGLIFADTDFDAQDDLPSEAPSPDSPRPPEGPQIDDIKRVFHPHSELPEVHLGFEEYRASQVPPKRRHPTDEKPWAPFRTRLDFEVAEFSQDAMLNKNQIDTLISLIRRCAENIADFTLHNQSDLNKQWDLASKKCTEFERFEVTVLYKASPQTFEMYARPLWNWAMDIVQDPHLADFFCWDAEQRYIFDGVNWQRFYTEPWTAEAMWGDTVKIAEVNR